MNKKETLLNTQVKNFETFQKFYSAQNMMNSDDMVEFMKVID
jgi:hypothetical protein